MCNLRLSLSTLLLLLAVVFSVKTMAQQPPYCFSGTCFEIRQHPCSDCVDPALDTYCSVQGGNPGSVPSCGTCQASTPCPCPNKWQVRLFDAFRPSPCTCTPEAPDFECRDSWRAAADLNGITIGTDCALLRRCITQCYLGNCQDDGNGTTVMSCAQYTLQGEGCPPDGA